MIKAKIFILLIIMALPLYSQTTMTPQDPFPNENAWSWYIKPVEVKEGACVVRDTVVLLLKNSALKRTQLTLIGYDELHEIVDLQAIAFDDSNHRYKFEDALNLVETPRL